MEVHHIIKYNYLIFSFVKTIDIAVRCITLLKTSIQYSFFFDYSTHTNLSMCRNVSIQGEYISFKIFVV